MILCTVSLNKRDNIEVRCKPSISFPVAIAVLATALKEGHSLQSIIDELDDVELSGGEPCPVPFVVLGNHE